MNNKHMDSEDNTSVRSCPDNLIFPPHTPGTVENRGLLAVPRKCQAQTCLEVFTHLLPSSWEAVHPDFMHLLLSLLQVSADMTPLREAYLIIPCKMGLPYSLSLFYFLYISYLLKLCYLCLLFYSRSPTTMQEPQQQVLPVLLTSVPHALKICCSKCPFIHRSHDRVYR